MTTQKALTRLAALGLGLAVCLPCLGQTSEQIEQRLEDLRRMDAEAAIRREETLEFQARRKREEYARRWKRYGDVEIDVLKWWQQKDGTWVTEVKKVVAKSTQAPFDASLDSLVRDGVVSPAERARISSGSDVKPFNVPDHQQACSSGALPHQECSSGLLVRWRGRFHPSPDSIGGLPQNSESSKNLIGVTCSALMVNRKPPYMHWGTWTRPEKGSTDEQLVIDRCASPTRLATP